MSHRIELDGWRLFSRPSCSLPASNQWAPISQDEAREIATDTYLCALPNCGLIWRNILSPAEH